MITRRAPGPRRWRRRLLLVATGTGLAVSLAEVTLRVLNATLWPPIYRVDAQLGWRHPANCRRQMVDELGRQVTFATDQHGLRVSTRAAEEGPDERLVLFVGDSFTEASQVEAEEAFPARVAASVERVRYLNAGVGGYSTLQELLAVREQLRSFRPALVVLTVYDNDFIDNLMPVFSGLGPRPHVQVDGDRVLTVLEPDVAAFEPYLQPAPGAFWLYRNCAIYRSVHKNLFLPRHGEELSQRENAARATFSAAQQRSAMSHLLARMHKAVAAAGSRLLIAAIPTREQALANDAPDHGWLARECGQLEIPFVSLLAPLHVEGAASAYYAEDIHLTAAGHACVATALAPRVARCLR
jgi:lysophospholipase L1-like esterase